MNDLGLGFKEMLTGLAAGLIGTVVILRKLQVGWKNDGGHITAIETMENLVKTLRDEIDRLHGENSKLRTELYELRDMVENLKGIVDRRHLPETST